MIIRYLMVTAHAIYHDAWNIFAKKNNRIELSNLTLLVSRKVADCLSLTTAERSRSGSSVKNEDFSSPKDRVSLNLNHRILLIRLSDIARYLRIILNFRLLTIHRIRHIRFGTNHLLPKKLKLHHYLCICISWYDR